MTQRPIPFAIQALIDGIEADLVFASRLGEKRKQGAAGFGESRSAARCPARPTADQFLTEGLAGVANVFPRRPIRNSGEFDRILDAIRLGQRLENAKRNRIEDFPSFPRKPKVGFDRKSIHPVHDWNNCNSQANPTESILSTGAAESSLTFSDKTRERQPILIVHPLEFGTTGSGDFLPESDTTRTFPDRGSHLTFHLPAAFSTWAG